MNNEENLEDQTSNATMDSQIARSQDSEQPILPNLPFELITEILLRLPVKSILKFRCVSKSWLTLTFSSRFIKAHLKVSAENQDSTRHKLILLDLSHTALKSCSLQSFLDAPSADIATNISPPEELVKRSFCLVGSCDGLICLEVKYDLYLWNPCTRKSKKLPRPTFEGRSERFYCVYGFGYEKSSDDYKVVAILAERSELDGVYRVTQVSIYSIRTDSWRSIGNFGEGVELDKPGKLFNGKLHWEVRPFVVSVNLENEMCEAFELPYYGEHRIDSALGEFEGKLAVLCHHYCTFDVWVMKEYGVKESWTKIFNVIDGDDLWYNFYSPPLFFQKKNGEVVVLHGSLLTVYDLKNFPDNNPQLNRFHGYAEANIYVESLVQPWLMMD